MSAELYLLIATAITISFLHTLTGPDHYLPFIVLSKSRGWSLPKTIGWTVICGCGHVWSSVLIGLGGAAIGWTMFKYKWMDGLRGGIAGWAMFIFGLCYLIWGIRYARRNTVHKHFDVTENGDLYVFEHSHGAIVSPKERHKVTPWVMFIIFLLGPCEPMIPLLYFPAAKNSFYGMLLLIIIYTLSTIGTMVLMVTTGYYGSGLFKFPGIERYMHSLAGLTIFICGFGMIMLAW